MKNKWENRIRWLIIFISSFVLFYQFIIYPIFFSYFCKMGIEIHEIKNVEIISDLIIGILGVGTWLNARRKKK